MATTQFVIANNVNTQLAAAASNSATTLTLASSANLPTLSAGQVMPLTLNDAATGQNYEIVYVTAITGVTLTVTRAQEGTGALTWNVGDYAFCPPTAGTVATALGNPSNTFQVSPATAVNQAPQMSQVAGIAGSANNLVMSITTASASATLTADEIIVETALGGVRYCLPSFSKTINLATTGAGGMDTGTAPVSGFVAIYAIWNPTTSTAALLATNATSAVQPTIYSGANMPSGYTASALVAIVLTNASSQFFPQVVLGRRVWFSSTSVLSSTTAVANLTALSVSTLIPKNAKTVNGWSSLTSASGSTNPTFAIAGYATTTTNGLGQQQNTGAAAGYPMQMSFTDVPVVTSQTIYYAAFVATGTMNAIGINVNGFTF